MSNNTKNLIKVLISGVAVIAITFGIVFGMNSLMAGFMQYETDVLSAADFRTKQMQKAAEEGESIALQKEAEKAKYEQMEQFYQKYKNRDCYHYFGQFYEIFNNVYNADVFFIGTSHCAHGINPLYVEENNPEYSFFNFGLNGSIPSYYVDWYHILKNEANYPVPKVVIYCVDWFMCDTGWLWRRITYDSPNDMPLGIMRSMRAKAQKTDTVTETDESEIDDTVTVQGKKSLMQLIKESSPKSIDDLMTVVMINTPIFSSRDRIPEMLKWYGDGMPKNDILPPYTDEEIEDIISSYDENVEMPVYEHDYLRDPSSNLTHLYYKGYIPWDVNYGGSKQFVNCTDQESEWTAFESLLDEFEEDGVKVLFIEIPEYEGTKSTSKKKNNNRISKIAEQRGIQFINYNADVLEGISDDPSCYSDWGHMSLKGSTAFSEMLGEDLKPILAELIGDDNQGG